MIVQSTVTLSTFLHLTRKLQEHAMACAGSHPGPVVDITVCEVKNGLRNRRWDPQADAGKAHDPQYLVEAWYLTTGGNVWYLRCHGALCDLTYTGSRGGWRSLHGPFGAEPDPHDPKIARIAGRIARITSVESSAGALGEDPWLFGHEVRERLAEEAALVAPALPGEETPMREPLRRHGPWDWFSVPGKTRSWKESRKCQYRWVLA
jgi:hypothetical protein